MANLINDTDVDYFVRRFFPSAVFLSFSYTKKGNLELTYRVDVNEYVPHIDAQFIRERAAYYGNSIRFHFMFGDIDPQVKAALERFGRD